MKTKIHLILFIAFLYSGRMICQDTLKVGESLNAKVATMTNGSTLIIQQGTHYAQYGGISVLSKNIRIIGEAGAQKPLVYLEQFNIDGAEAGLYLEGIEFTSLIWDTINNIETTDITVDGYFINLPASMTTCKTIKVEDCVIRNFDRALIRGDRAAYTVDSILFNNCIVYDHRGGGNYGLLRFKTSISFNSLILKNSTFYKFKNGIVDCESISNVASDIKVDNCTFYNVGLNKNLGKSLFDLRANINAGCRLTISDCIFGLINKDDPTYEFNGFRFTNEAYAEMSFCVMTPEFVVDTFTYDQVVWDKDESNHVGVNPGFANPENGNFTIPANSDIRGYASDGGIVGDPRWAVLPSSIKAKKSKVLISVYPVPAIDVININAETPGIYEIYNMVGIKVRELNISENGIYTENVKGLKSGVYFLKLKGENASQKLIIK